MKKLHPKIGDTNHARYIKALIKAADDERVEEIEGGGMDEGRVFIHFKTGFWLGPCEATHSASVGSAADVREAMSQVQPCPYCNGENGGKHPC